MAYSSVVKTEVDDGSLAWMPKAGDHTAQPTLSACLDPSVEICVRPRYHRVTREQKAAVTGLVTSPISGREGVHGAQRAVQLDIADASG